MTTTIRVLIVDDEPTSCELITTMLRKNEYQVAGTANNGKTVLAQCIRQQPDLVLLDIELQDDDGLHVLGQLRRGYPEIPVLILGSDSNLERAKLARQGGARGFLAKPFTTERLMRAVERALLDSR
jgi:DNA-binding NtrC family response regulator